jgi:hypothetical protein
MNSDNPAGGALDQLRGVLRECEKGAAGFDHNCLSKIKSVWSRYGIDANCLLLARWPGSEFGVYTGKILKGARRWVRISSSCQPARGGSDVAKITLPSPCLFVNFWSPERSQSAYASLEHFLADVVAILRDEVAELVRLGATYIQIDAA